MSWDFFISHAYGEDKADVARPLADMLRAKGYEVWYDEYTLTVGDNLRSSIEQGLAQSRYAVVVLSPSFFAKKWTNLELDGLFALERTGEKRILPVWHNVSATDVEAHSSFMAMRPSGHPRPTPAFVVEMIEQAMQKEASDNASQPTTPSVVGLHPNTIELLAAAKESNGTIMALEHLSGFSVGAGGKSFGDDGDPRAEALNRHSLEELVLNGLAEQPGDGIYELTQEGFDYEVPAGIVQARQPEFADLSSANGPLAKQLMRAAAAGAGRLILGEFMDGDVLQAGEQVWESGRDRRTVARWKSVLKELAEAGLLIDRYDKTYSVSHLGYLWTDSLNATEAETSR